MTLNSLQINRQHLSQDSKVLVYQDQQYQQSSNQALHQMFKIRYKMLFSMRQQFITLTLTVIVINAAADNLSAYYSMPLTTMNYSSSHLPHIKAVK
jgi:hypothetical protein